MDEKDKVMHLLERIAAAVEFTAVQNGHVPPKPPAPAPVPAEDESQRGAEQKEEDQ
jgi:hypothetical protein